MPLIRFLSLISSTLLFLNGIAWPAAAFDPRDLEGFPGEGNLEFTEWDSYLSFSLTVNIICDIHKDAFLDLSTEDAKLALSIFLDGINEDWLGSFKEANPYCPIPSLDEIERYSPLQ